MGGRFSAFSQDALTHTYPHTSTHTQKTQVIVHELFDAGLLGEGVLHLLQPIRQTAKRLLPARYVCMYLCVSLSLSLLNPTTS